MREKGLGIMAGLLKVLMTSAVPAGILAYLLFTWSIRAGRLTKTENHKGLRAEMKALKGAGKEKKKKSRNPVHNKWLKFGGGFYGVIALWTFMVIELAEVFQFVRDFTSITEMAMNAGPGPVIEFFVNSLMNFIAAIAWPAYWLSEFDGDLAWMWFALAYGGYWTGMQLARRKAHAEKAVEG